MSTRASCIWAAWLVPALLAAAPVSAATADPSNAAVLLLTGFEKPQLLSWGLRGTNPLEIKYRYRGSFVHPTAVAGDCTEGQYALAASYSAFTVKAYYLDRSAHHHVRFTRWLFATSDRNFRKWFPQDWSGYRYLRMDFKSTAAKVKLRVDLEDEIATPMVRRVFEVAPRQWVTLQYDLQAAAAPVEVALTGPNVKRFGREKIRLSRLNLTRMAGIRIYPEWMDKATTLLLDNVRLVKDRTAERTVLPLVIDERPFLTARELPAEGPRPRTPPANLALDRTPVAPGQPRGIEVIPRLRAPCYGRLRHITKRGLVAVDNRRMVLAFLGGRGGYECALQTLDGGETWRGLDGRPNVPTGLCHSVNAPAHVTVQAGNDVLVVYTERCCSGGNPSNMFFRLLEFDGKGWRLGPPRLVDVDCRHCPEWRVQALRLKNGRIWAAWMHDDRLQPIFLRARYSDDGGRTWRDPDSNALVTIDWDDSVGPQPMGVTWWTDEAKLMPPLARANGRVDTAYPHGNLLLTPYRDTVACIWTKGDTLVWSHFDPRLGQWTKPETVLRGYVSPYSALTVGEEEIYLSAAGKVLRLADGKWVDDTPPDGRGGLLSTSGNTILNFWTETRQRKAKLLVARKRPGAKWTAPEVLAVEDLPGTGKRAELDVIAPRHAPPNFVPVAFGPHHEWIKFLRLPTH